MITKLKRFGFFIYGKTIPGLTIDGKPAPYAVVNEREVRAGAGLMLLMALFHSFMASTSTISSTSKLLSSSSLLSFL